MMSRPTRPVDASSHDRTWLRVAAAYVKHLGAGASGLPALRSDYR